jgi:hypothetical protein
MPPRKSRPTLTACADQTPAAAAALASFRANPSLATARAVDEAFSPRCSECGKRSHVDDGTYLRFLAARLEDGPLAGAMHPSTRGRRAPPWHPPAANRRHPLARKGKTTCPNSQ